MKFYSEKLNKLFDTQDACAQAEVAHEKALAEAEAAKKAKADARAERAKKVEELYKAAINAKKAYDAELKDFLKDYGSFHATFKNVDPFFSIFDWF